MSSLEHANVYHRIETVENYAEIRDAAQTYIRDNLDKRLVITDFVRDKGFSQRQTQRALSYHDTNWQRMVLDERLKRAEQLLEHSSEPIGRVAEMIGYNHSQLSRIFKAEKGVKPDDFRKWKQDPESKPKPKPTAA
jgi:AraC-like DNA-binding protein